MKNTFINEYRRNKRANTFIDKTDNQFFINNDNSSDMVSPESRIAEKDIRKALSELTDDFRVPFEMYYNGYKYKEIAEKLDFFYCRFFGDEEKAKDFLQEIFFKIIIQTPVFSENRKFRYWVFRVAANMCKNEYRKQSIRRLHEEEMLKSRQESSKAEERPLLWKKLRKLNDEQCNLLLLRYKYQHSIKEIAQILEIPEGTVKSRLFKCIQDISKNIKNTEDQ